MASVTIDNETYRLLEKLMKERGKKSFNDLLKESLKYQSLFLGELEGIGKGKVREKKDRNDE